MAGVAGGQFFLAAQVDPGGAPRRCAHDRTGRRALRHGLVRQGVTRGACEAPGRYPRRLHQGLHAAGIETVGAHPQHARRCAEALGQHLQEASLETCRRELRAVLRVLDRRLQRLPARLAATLAADAARALRASLPGLGPASVAALLAGLPELGAHGRRAAAGLLGVAPGARDSGLRSGARRIPGGRPHPRRVLSRAALSASRGHPPRRPWGPCCASSASWPMSCSGRTA